MRGAAPDSERSDAPKHGAWALAAVLVVGFLVRFVGLDDAGLSQAESFTPGIPFPDYAVVPPARMTVIETLRSTLWHDVHPPVFYLFMLGWVKTFGTGLNEMRAAAAGLGVAGLFAVYALVRREDGVRIALGAAALLALNGLHIYYSQRSRGWVLAYLLVTIATMLLIRLDRSPRRGTGASYLAASTLGLWTSYGFWPLFIGHGAYALLGGMRAASALRALRLQAIALILSSSLVVVLRAQLNHSHDIEEALAIPMFRLFALNGMIDDVALVPWHPPLGALLFAAASAFGAALLWLGARSPAASAVPPATLENAAVGDERSPRAVASIALALGIAALSLVGLRWLGVSSLHRLAVGVGFAGAIAIAWAGLAAAWPHIAATLDRVRAQRFVRSVFSDPATAIVVVFFGVLVFASVAIKPMLVPRNLLIVGPLSAWLVARGVTALPRFAPRWVQHATLAALAAIAVLSAHHGRTNLYDSPISYGSVYAAIEPHLRDGDRFSVEATWFAQPIFYYVDYEKYPSRPPEEWLEVLASPEERRRPQRLWTFIWGLAEPTDQGVATETERFAAAGLRATQRIDGRTVSAVLFERDALAD